MSQIDKLENIFDEDKLLLNLKGSAYFILLYEIFEDAVISTVKEFYSEVCVIDGKLYNDIDESYIKTLKKKIAEHEKSDFIPNEVLLRHALWKKEKYQQEISPKKKESDHNDGKVLKGSLYWLQKHDVFSEEEVIRIADIRKRRNEIVHELLKILYDGLTENDAAMTVDLLNYYVKLCKWHFQHVDMPVMEYELPDGVQPEMIKDSSESTLLAIFRILFLNEGSAFREALEQLREDDNAT